VRRAALALASVFALAAVAVAGAAERLPRVTGDVAYENFGRLESYLRQAAGKQIGLDLTLPLDNAEERGHLTTFMLDGQFELSHIQPDHPTKIYLDGGEINLVDDKSYTIDGVYAVELADEGNEVPSLYLVSVDAEGAAFDDVQMIDLPAKTGN